MQKDRGLNGHKEEEDPGRTCVMEEQADSSRMRREAPPSKAAGWSVWCLTRPPSEQGEWKPHAREERGPGKRKDGVLNTPVPPSSERPP